MSSPTPRYSTKTLVRVWASVAVVMAVAVIWGATQADDPLSRYISTDTQRHILAFGALGLCGALMPTAKARLIALGSVLVFGVAVEVIQIPIAGRGAQWKDLFASSVGAFAGFGFGAAAMGAFEWARDWLSARAKSVSQRR